MIDDVSPDRLAFTDLDEWRTWQWGRQPLVRRKWRQLRYGSTADDAPASVQVWNGNKSGGYCLFALDGASPSHVAAIAAPLRLLIAMGAPVALLGEPPADFPRGIDASTDELNDLPIHAAVSVGDHLANGARVKALATSHDVPHLVVQHGALTPYSPPPTRGDIVLAWSEGDAQMWTAGHSGVGATAVGSEMLWMASQHRKEASTPGEATPLEAVFLGQLHGAELPRRTTLESVRQLRRQTSLTYRPHPAETDLLSRMQHGLWRSQGVAIDLSGSPLTELGVAVVAHFSTGLLEAAAAGAAAFGYSARAPRWVQGFWQRYGIAEWGSGEETLVPISSQRPAEITADRVTGSW